MESIESHNPYDEVLYPGYPFPQTHPDRLATIARLFEMNPAPIERCRVLELGCGDGGNLIPMAYTLPGSEFMGLDLGERCVAAGQETISALGLSNVRLVCLDILEAGTDLGQFDYIIAHGVYSWVPPAVQERILAICRENLNPQGAAYVSYNVYPGAHVRNMLAEMLRYHARRFSAPGERIEQAAAMLSFLSAARPPQDAYSALLRHEVEVLSTRRKESLFHDELAEFQAPVYFRQFAERAAAHQLQYLGESDFFEMVDSAEPPEIRSRLQGLAADPIEKEQYLDFLKCRRFRQTLLCHSEVTLNRHVESSRVRNFFVSTRRRVNQEQEQLPSEHPVAKAAFAALGDAWPAALSFEELKERAGAEDEPLLCDIVLGFFACGVFQLHVSRPPMATTVAERPRASALARLQARTGEYVTSLRHQVVHLEDDISRRLLRALDGTRDRAALARELAVESAELERALHAFVRLALLE